MEVILPLQAYSGIHIGIDNLNVLRGVAALLSHNVPRSPFPLVKDGDLLATIRSMLCLRGFDTSPRLRVMLLVSWLTMVMFVLKIWLVAMVLMLLLIWGGEGSRMMSSLLVVTFSGFVAFGTQSFSISINSWLLFLV